MSMMDSLEPIGPLADLYREEQAYRDLMATIERSSALNNAGGTAPPMNNPPVSAMDRVGLSVANTPMYRRGRNDSPGQAALASFVGGFARGYGGATERNVAARDREAERERLQAAEANKRRIDASERKRAEASTAANTLARIRWDKTVNPDKTLAQIEAEAKARSAGTTAGEGTGTQDVVPGLTQEGLDVTALNYAKTGQLPPMGMGKVGAAVRARIINRAAQMDPNLDLATNRANFGANKTSLTALQRQTDAYKSYESTVKKNSAVLRDAMTKIGDTGSPLFNTPLRSIQKHLLGSQEQAAYEAAVRTVVPEFARLLNNPNLTGQLTDTARKEIDEIIAGNYTLKQMEAAIQVLEKDARNRIEASQGQIDETRGRIQASPYAPRGGGAKPKMRYDPATKTLVPVGP